ncbi:MAG: DUF2029 domain-containing protein [Chloroflexi bacterium]|nr:DUF2029 domain-containing protein [Chloroflexota bacterium]
MFKDIDIFVAAAQAIWNGQDPYRLAGMEAFYPLPFYFLFLPFAWLPLPVVHALWSGMSGIVFVAILKRRALPAMLSAQALLTFLLGQVDIVMMGLYAMIQSGGKRGGIALAFLVLKPHIVLLLAPFLLWRWWQTNRRQLWWFLAVGSVLALASFILQPNWAFSLLARSGERMRVSISSSLWGMLSFLPAPVWFGVVVLIAVALIVWVWRWKNVDAVETLGLFLSPFIFAYNYIPLYTMFKSSRVLLAMAALSWFGFWIADMQSNDRASALVAVFAIILFARQWLRERHSQKPDEGG